MRKIHPEFLRPLALTGLLMLALTTTALADTDIYYEVFSGTGGVKPLGWWDESNDGGFNAYIRYSYAGSYAAVSTAAGEGWGKVQSNCDKPGNVDTDNLKLEIVVNSLSGGNIKVGVFRQSPSYSEGFSDQIFTAGTHTFDVNTITAFAWSGNVTMGVQILTEGGNAIAEIASVRIFSQTADSPTPTQTVTRTPTLSPTITPTLTPSPTAGSMTATPTISATRTISPTFTPTATPTNGPPGSPTNTPTVTTTFTVTVTSTPVALAFFDHFTSGAEGTLPPGWRDNTTNPGFNATLVRSGASAAVASTTAFGKVLSQVLTDVNLNSNNELQVVVSSVAPGTVFRFALQGEVAPFPNSAVASALSSPGIYVYRLPWVGTATLSLEILFTSATGSITIDSVRLAGGTNPTTTPTVIFTATPTLTPLVGQGFFDHFTSGSEGAPPPGWRDQNLDPNFAATIRRLGASEAVVAKSNTAAGFGKALSQVLDNFDYTANPELQVLVTEVNSGTAFGFGIQMEVDPFTYTQVAGGLTAPGLYVYNLPLSGAQTSSVDIRITSDTGAVTLDYIRLGTRSTPTVTATATATPVPHVFRPARNLFRPKEGPLRLYYGISQPGNLRITVYNLAGQKVKALLWDERITEQVSGFVDWDGTNANNEPVASGVYIVRFDGPGFQKNIRVGLVK